MDSPTTRSQPVSTAVIERTLSSFARTTDEIVSLAELQSLPLSGRQLVLKFYADVTAADLHIGHAVNLWMYRELQDLGHKIVSLKGDFTTGIGDHSGRNKLRPVIPDARIKKNVDEFIRQVKRVLREDPEVLEIRRNSEWLGSMSAKELLNLLSLVTNEHLRSRDIFQNRIAEGSLVYEHELCIPSSKDTIPLHSKLTLPLLEQINCTIK